MSADERAALVARLRKVANGLGPLAITMKAADLIEADGKRLALAESSFASLRIARQLVAAEKTIDLLRLDWRTYQAADRDIVNGRPVDDALEERAASAALIDQHLADYEAAKEAGL